MVENACHRWGYVKGTPLRRYGQGIAELIVAEERRKVEGLGYEPTVPIVTSISPATKDEGYESFTATITGENFQSVSQAKIGTTGLTDEDVTSKTSLTATVPAGLSAGIHDVSVSNIDLVWGTGSGLYTARRCFSTSSVRTGLSTFTSSPTTIFPSSSSGLIAFAFATRTDCSLYISINSFLSSLPCP